jgi:hypothetical protein
VQGAKGAAFVGNGRHVSHVSCSQSVDERSADTWSLRALIRRVTR